MLYSVAMGFVPRTQVRSVRARSIKAVAERRTSREAVECAQVDVVIGGVRTGSGVYATSTTMTPSGLSHA